MECMINILLSHGIPITTMVATVVMAVATWQIMKFNANQTKIAEQKRKDDLFETRWKFYDEIVKIINKCLSDLKCPIYKDLNNPNVKSKIEKEDKAKYLLYLAMVKCLKSKARWLFDEELATWLEVQLMNGYFSKWGSKRKPQIFPKLASII
jgi:hypothetical protein